MKKIEFFKVEGNKINRIRRHCPKCGPGVFIAEHKDRFSCGKCGYTEFKSGGKKERPVVPQDKPAEKPKEPIKEEATKPAEKTEEKPVEKEEKQEQTSDKADNKIEEKEENKKE